MNLRRTVFFLGLSCQVGCAPHWYDGEFAVLIDNDATMIARHDTDLGDCYRVFSGLPSVYAISRPNYTLHVAHGNRYWPEFYLAAESKDDSPLEIIGSQIELHNAFLSKDRHRVEEARGLQLSHQTVRLDRIQGNSITVAILDSQWDVLGIEELKYEILEVNCFLWDSI